MADGHLKRAGFRNKLNQQRWLSQNQQRGGSKEGLSLQYCNNLIPGPGETQKKKTEKPGSSGKKGEKKV